MINGIEFLKKIKNSELKLNQKINVYYDNKDVSYDLVAILTYKGNEVIWSENTFRFSMLYDDNYLFEIIENKPIIEKIDTTTENTLFTMECYTGIPEKAQDWNFNVLKNKLNEVIDHINRKENNNV